MECISSCRQRKRLRHLLWKSWIGKFLWDHSSTWLWWHIPYWLHERTHRGFNRLCLIPFEMPKSRLSKRTTDHWYQKLSDRTWIREIYQVRVEVDSRPNTKYERVSKPRMRLLFPEWDTRPGQIRLPSLQEIILPRLLCTIPRPREQNVLRAR